MNVNMAFFENIKINSIISNLENFMEHKAFRSLSKMPYNTLYEYEMKLRDAEVSLILSQSTGSTIISMRAIAKKSGVPIFPLTAISSADDCLSVAHKIWQKIEALDKASTGNLDGLEYFNYLDYIFFLAHALKKWEGDNRQLFPYKKLSDWTHQVSMTYKNSFPCDPEVAAKDVCKIIGENKLITRYIQNWNSSSSNEIDDNIFLGARVLIESSYDGVSAFKQRNF